MQPEIKIVAYCSIYFILLHVKPQYYKGYEISSKTCIKLFSTCCYVNIPITIFGMWIRQSLTYLKV